MSETVPNAFAAADAAAAAAPFDATNRSILGKTGAAKVTSSFDRSAHQPFRLDNKGLNKEMSWKDAAKATMNNTLGAPGEEVKIPSWWMSGSQTTKTFTELNKNRRKEWVPDISYDLDGDGVVGNRDLVLSKMFDKDGDGKLNAEERKNAEEAIRNVSYTTTNNIVTPLYTDCALSHSFISHLFYSSFCVIGN